MKTSVYFKAVKDVGNEGLSSVCFRVRDKEIDIKAASELQVVAKYWDEDALYYRRNNVVSKEEQRRVTMQITAITERVAATFARY